MHTEERLTNATTVTMQPFGKASLRYIWKHNGMQVIWKYVCCAMHVESTLWMLNLDFLINAIYTLFMQLIWAVWYFVIFQITILITILLETDQGHLIMGTFDQNCQKVPKNGTLSAQIQKRRTLFNAIISSKWWESVWWVYHFWKSNSNSNSSQDKHNLIEPN